MKHAIIRPCIDPELTPGPKSIRSPITIGPGCALYYPLIPLVDCLSAGFSKKEKKKHAAWILAGDNAERLERERHWTKEATGSSSVEQQKLIIRERLMGREKEGRVSEL